MGITIGDLESYLAHRYGGWGIDQSMFMKLVEEIGEVAEVLNKRDGRKASDDADLTGELANELVDVVHYAIAIAALNGIDMTKAILEKDRSAALKYHHRINLEQFLSIQDESPDRSV